jgi:methionyl-tRNA formyltransferase
MIMSHSNIRFAFFGTSHIARFVADELLVAGFAPTRVVTAPDRPQGRGMTLTESTMSVWARVHDFPTDKPEKLTPEWITTFAKEPLDVCVVIDYGFILPQELIDVPRRGFVNVHPSLLPRLRGPSPIRSAILTDERNTGVTIIQLDDKMDHGPIIAQQHVPITPWPPHAADLEESLARAGGKLLASILPQWVRGDIIPTEQDHTKKTVCKLIKKEHALINLVDDGYANLLKVRAYEGWPQAYTFFERNYKKIRVVIADAHVDTKGHLILDRVIPEGKREMGYEEFARSGAVPCTD